MDITPQGFAPHSDTAPLSLDQIAQYRRDGWVLLKGMLGPNTIAACKQALTDLATGALPPCGTTLMYETGTVLDGLSPAEAELCIRKYMDFTDAHPALRAAAMSARLHAALDQLLGVGRVLFQEMALVKPPRIGSAKPWHQDAAYFRLTDPGLIVGTWIALDHSSTANGCMELVPGSHLEGGAPHHHENDFNLCRIVDGRVRLSERLAIEMQPGDALLFHSLLQHYTAPNTSELRRRALQYHYHQIGAVWGDLADHRTLFHDDDGEYAGCTVAHSDLPGGNYLYRTGGLPRTIVPADTSD